MLTDAQVAQYHNDGCIFPLRVMSEQAALACREQLETFERASGGPLRGELRHKSHLLFHWIADLIRNERILDAVADLYGTNLLCWTTNFFIKEARNPAFVSWHQDSTYWGLDRPDVVTAWVALT
ncbi:MAG: phytanoyl-CoA dioxygenase family protein, partial [Burkholderiaceae bacterium]